MEYKYKIGQHVTVQRWKKVTQAKITSLGVENDAPVYDTDDGHWCYEDQIIAAGGEPVPVTLSREQAEKTAELLRGYYSALDNILYDKFSYEDLQKMLNDIDDLALTIERQL